MQSQPSTPNFQPDPYQLFILRVWQDGPDGPLRYLLKAADDSQRHIFTDAHSLADFLEQVTETEQGDVA